MQVTPSILTDYLQKTLGAVSQAGNTKLRFADIRLYVPGEAYSKDHLYLLPEADMNLAFEQGFSAIVPVSSKKKTPPAFSRDICIIYAYCERDRLFNLVSECFSMYAERFEQIYEAIAAGDSMETILEKCYPMLQNPFFIDDSSYRTLARLRDYPASDFKDDEYIFMQRHGHHSPEYIYAMLSSSVAVESSAISPRPVVHKFDFLSHRTLYSTIKVNSEIAGFFSCLEVETPFTGGVVDLFESLTGLMALALGRESGLPLSLQQGLHNDLYLGVLSGSITDPDLADTAFAQLDLKPGAWFVLRAATNVPLADNPFLLPRIVELLISNLEKGSFAVTDGPDIILVMKGDPAAEQTDRLVQLIRFYLREYEVTIGVSLGFADPRQMSLYHAQALAAVRLGPRLSGGEGVYSYGHVVEYDILDRLGGAGKREAICHPAVRLLYGHDREKGTKFLLTLKAYIQCLGDTARAAEMLFLHRNSLYYRLNQIENLTGLDLSDGILLAHIMTSIRVYELDQEGLFTEE